MASQGYPRGQRELIGPLTRKFGPDETYDWFQAEGVTLKTESDGRVCHHCISIMFSHI